MPTVETVICRQPSAPSELSASRRTAARTASRFSNGSPHAHEHDGLKLAPDSVCFATQRQELFHDFSGGEIALKASLRRGAKITAHGAADLGRKAARGAVRAEVRHEHGFHRPSVAEAQEKFRSAIVGHLTHRKRCRAVSEYRAQLLDKTGWQSTRRRRRKLIARVKRPQHARRVTGFVAPDHELLRQRTGIKISERGGYGQQPGGSRGVHANARSRGPSLAVEKSRAWSSGTSPVTHDKCRHRIGLVSVETWTPERQGPGFPGRNNGSHNGFILCHARYWVLLSASASLLYAHV